MQYKYILLSGVFCALFFEALSQKSLTGSVSGVARDAFGKPVPGATIKLHNGKGTNAGNEGNYILSNLKPGKYSLEFSSVGYEKAEKRIQIKADENLIIDFIVKASINDMEEVSVIGRTANSEVNRQAFNVTSVDAKKLHNSTLDLSHALDRVSGVRIREDGGVGSRINFSLNGFTGRQVKFFMDGVPIDNFGSSFQLNNIPINLAERVEVYKGVVPIWLGSDALGGAVNIVTSNAQSSYVDVSYSFGSFNTHRSAVNAGYTAKSGFTAQVNLFQNYSDNNYWINADVSDINTGEYYPNQRIRRFHDRYRNETMIANIGVVGKKYADKLLIGVTLGQNRAEIQTGARMVSVFGNLNRKGNIVMPTIKYQKKDLLLKGLSLSLTGNFNLGEEQNIDTVYRRYNWFQEYKQYAGSGSERERTLYKYRNNNGLATANLSYQISDKHSVILNNVYNTFNRKGSDELFPENKRNDQPRKNTKNITGLGYKYDHNQRWNASAFVKQFLQNNTYSIIYTPSGANGADAYKVQKNNFSKQGYGLATTYFLNPALQLKASFEKSFRLPETDELFGDLINLEGNIDLDPESSYNYNLGMNYNVAIHKIHRFSFDANLLYRNAKDFIRPRLNQNQTKQVMDNLMNVTNLGLDGEIRYSYKRLFAAGVNLTYQNLRNNTKFEDGYTSESILYKDRIPNMPFLFGNADASFFFNDLGKKGNTLTLGYNLLYVHAYYLYWPSLGDDKLDIPQQFSHDVNAVYSMANGKYNVALEAKNILDSRLYDNFSLQKPSRAFYVKLRYFISKK